MKKLKLLLLDDDNDVRKNLQMFFEDEGFECYSFEHPYKALSFLASNTVDIAIVDLRLPSINGEEFILESYKLSSIIKYLIYTGSSDYFISNELKELGMNQDDVISKPVNSMDIFIQKIQSCFS